MVSVTIMVGKTVTMKMTIRERQEPWLLGKDSGDDNDDDDMISMKVMIKIIGSLSNYYYYDDDDDNFIKQ